MSAHVFQVGDRILKSDEHGETWTGTIRTIRPVNADTAYAYAWRDDDPEHSRGLEIADLTADLTGARYPRIEHVELWDGGINGAWTSVDTYDCPEPGCDYNVSAVGTPDPDEPDYYNYNEGIDAHERGHAESASDPTGALTAPPGVELVPPPGMTPDARQLLTDQFAALAATGSVAHAPSPTGLAPYRVARQAVPALVQLDWEEAVQAALVSLGEAALAWQATDPDQPEGIEAEGVLSDATSAYRALVTR
jgi:hypothetical protein